MSKPFFIYQGDLGPFQPPLPAEVTVWVALIMKKNNKCSIMCPDWLSVGNFFYFFCKVSVTHFLRVYSKEHLKSTREQEEQNQDFSVLPFHYMEIAQMLLET